MQKKKKPIERKHIQDALAARFPLYWERHGFDFELHAVTYSWENGTQRTRLLWRKIAWTRGDLEAVEAFHKSLMENRVNMPEPVELERLMMSFYDDFREKEGIYYPRRTR